MWPPLLRFVCNIIILILCTSPLTSFDPSPSTVGGPTTTVNMAIGIDGGDGTGETNAEPGVRMAVAYLSRFVSAQLSTFQSKGRYTIAFASIEWVWLEAESYF